MNPEGGDKRRQGRTMYPKSTLMGWNFASRRLNLTMRGEMTKAREVKGLTGTSEEVSSLEGVKRSRKARNNDKE
jgi:hypothetical protein